MNKSIWDNIDYDVCDSLSEDIETDVLIVGGGIAGMSACYHLRNSGLKITLIDRESCGRGVSLYTTGKLTYLQKLNYYKLEKDFGFEKAKDYLFATKGIIEEVEKIIEINNIDCDFKKVPSYVVANKKEDLKYFEMEKSFLDRCNVHSELYLETPYGDNQYTLKVTDGAVFHPYKYITSLKDICLKNGVRIYENTIAFKMRREGKNTVVETDGGEIKSKYIVIATHFPFVNFPGFYFMRMHLDRSYVNVCKGNGEYTSITANDPVKSIRFHDEYLLFGGSNHPLSMKFNYENKHNKLESLRKKYFPNNTIMSWSTHDCISQDGLPYIGKFNGYNNVFVATGFNKWGMTNGSISGKIISDLIQGNENKYIDLFSPSRKINIKNFTKDLMTSASNFFSTSENNKIIYVNNGKVTKKKIVKTIEDEEYIVDRKCPHLGCKLFFNDTDQTWDCPCHGSRFNIKGEVIQGPSTKNIS
ncbi:FAD-dependent oxidoreductase [Mycoplasmatota bacterium WC44]